MSCFFFGEGSPVVTCACAVIRDLRAKRAPTLQCGCCPSAAVAAWTRWGRRSPPAPSRSSWKSSALGRPPRRAAVLTLLLPPVGARRRRSEPPCRGRSTSRGGGGSRASVLQPAAAPAAPRLSRLQRRQQEERACGGGGSSAVRVRCYQRSSLLHQQSSSGRPGHQKKSCRSRQREEHNRTQGQMAPRPEAQAATVTLSLHSLNVSGIGRGGTEIDDVVRGASLCGEAIETQQHGAECGVHLAVVRVMPTYRTRSQRICCTHVPGRRSFSTRLFAGRFGTESTTRSSATPGWRSSGRRNSRGKSRTIVSRQHCALPQTVFAK